MNKLDWIKEYRALTGAYLKEAVNVYEHYTDNGRLDVTPRDAVGKARIEQIKHKVLTNYTIVVGFNTPVGIVEKTFNVNLPDTREEMEHVFNSMNNGAPETIRLGNLLLRNFSYFYIS